MVDIDNGKSRKKSILPTRSKLVHRFNNKKKNRIQILSALKRFQFPHMHGIDFFQSSAY